MITYGFLYLFYKMGQAFANLLPSFDIEMLSGMFGAIGWAFGYMMVWDFIFPVSEFLEVFKLVILLETVFWGVKMTIFVLKILRILPSHLAPYEHSK